MVNLGGKQGSSDHRSQGGGYPLSQGGGYPPRGAAAARRARGRRLHLDVGGGYKDVLLQLVSRN